METATTSTGYLGARTDEATGFDAQEQGAYRGQEDEGNSLAAHFEVNSGQHRHTDTHLETHYVARSRLISLIAAAEFSQDGKSLQPDKRLITPSEVYTTFEKMTDSNLNIIGLSDEREQEGPPAHVISEFEQLLQFHVHGQRYRWDTAGGSACQGDSCSSEGQGRVRGNLMGKRADFSARTDPNLELDEVGVPKLGLWVLRTHWASFWHGGCGHTQPQVRKEGLKLFVQYKKSKEDDEDGKSLQPDKRLITPSEVYTTFKKMTDLHIIGLSEEYARPEWMILTVMPVPPPPVRPSIAVDGGAMRSEDDLTYKLGDIIKASANVRRCEQEGAPALVISEFEQLLQFHVATYMDNDIAGIPQALQKSGRPVKAIRARDPNLELDEVGVPKSIAMNLTSPERVTPYNISYLQELVRNGPTTYPGARYVVRDTGERIDLRYNKRADAFLQYGWIVERHLKDGDYVLFNRQPSLHKMSMISHRVKLMPYVSLESCRYAALQCRFRRRRDEHAYTPERGDASRTESDSLGTAADRVASGEQAGYGDLPIPAIIKPKPMWTGKQILSLAIPRGINIFRAAEPKSSNPVFDDGMCIENGEIIWGIVEKKTVGASQGGLVHVVFREKGPEGARALFSGLQKVVNYWLFHNGFSIGIGDTIADAKTMAFITQTIASHKAEVAAITERATIDELKAVPGMTIRESFESQVERQLNLARDTSGQYAQKNLKEDNNVKQMVVAGSKGSFINISQMSVCVGQQSVEGRRIPFGFRHRTLPHFTKDDFSPEARGFVENSYLRGLTPQEFFFHAMAGREGLIDTAVKTAETGYIQRRLVKALEEYASLGFWDARACVDGIRTQPPTPAWAAWWPVLVMAARICQGC
ncbi:DNA-directed RNA polymerase II subunit rpb1 [Pleurotus pulmonarius]|nr:DNA-directed RNA polymerase II subunit rpb1 [Pleurotus pulmonarius]